jgi:hypothetical protein
VIDDEQATPAMRIRAARAAAEMTAQEQLSNAAAWLETAVRLLPETITDDLAPADQQHAMSQCADLAADAAALALADPRGSPQSRAATALRLLEMGRAIILGQALRLRTDVSDLSHRYPVLAERLLSLRRAVQGDGTGDRRAATRQLAELLAEIRALDGFASFALPPALEELQRQAREGPIVTINVSRYRSDALILTAKKVTSLPLPALTRQLVIENAARFHAALSEIEQGTTLQARGSEEAKLRTVLHWLWESLAEPVLKELGYSRPASPDAPPRMWWVPGGIMSLLPVHAAMHETADGPAQPVVHGPRCVVVHADHRRAPPRPRIRRPRRNTDPRTQGGNRRDAGHARPSRRAAEVRSRRGHRPGRPAHRRSAAHPRRTWGTAHAGKCPPPAPGRPHSALRMPRHGGPDRSL